MRCLALLLVTLGTLPLALPAQDSAPSTTPAPALPDSPLKSLAAQLTKARTARAQPAKAAPADKRDLLRPELAFKPRRRWLLVPELAKQLGADDEQRNAVRDVLDAGLKEARAALAKEGAENDVGAALTLFISQLWQAARGVDVPEANVDALHTQIVGALATPEVAAMSDADKQRFWEFCIGYPIFLAAMGELLENDDQRADLRKAAGLGFAAVLGVAPDAVDIGDGGLAPRVAGKPAASNDGAAESEAGSRTAAPAAAASALSTTALPRTARAIRAVTHTPPPGWSKESSDGNVVYRTALGEVDREGRPVPNDDSAHQAMIAFLPVLTADAGPSALFDQLWRMQFKEFELGDTVAHFRGRLPSQLVMLYMGRFFARPDAPRTNGNPRTYGVLYLVDLGDNRFQPIVAAVVPHAQGLGMDMMREGSALQALSFPLWALLQTVQPERGAPPYPAGGFFAADDLRGRWSESSGAFGGHYYNSNTGSYAGAAVLSSGGHLYLNDDGTYEYAFAYASSHPQFGNSGGSTKHSGKYRLDGDIVLVEPSKPVAYEFTCCAAGIGMRQTPAGPRRVLITVSKHRDGGFRSAPMVPNWDNYDGVMSWYVDEGPR